MCCQEDEEEKRNWVLYSSFGCWDVMSKYLGRIGSLVDRTISDEAISIKTDHLHHVMRQQLPNHGVFFFFYPFPFCSFSFSLTFHSEILRGAGISSRKMTPLFQHRSDRKRQHVCQGGQKCQNAMALMPLEEITVKQIMWKGMQPATYSSLHHCISSTLA